MSVKISIITITWNSERYIEETITSVANQTYPNIEYIIIDGGSTDATLDIIKKYEPKIDRWISEPDGGIADAMNKGLALATGDYILFLHSDDYLLNPSVVEQAVPHLTAPYDIVMFNIILERNSRKTLSIPRGLNKWINFKTGVYHQSVFCSNKLFKQIGIFDTQFKIVMDYDFFLRAYKTNTISKKINLPISVMRQVGLSARQDWQGLKARFLEEKQVHVKNNNNPLMRLLYTFYWSLYFPYRRVRYLCAGKQ